MSDATGFFFVMICTAAAALAISTLVYHAAKPCEREPTKYEQLKQRFKQQQAIAQQITDPDERESFLLGLEQQYNRDLAALARE